MSELPRPAGLVRAPDLAAHAVVSFHDRFLLGEGEDTSPGAVWGWIAENHRCNAALWKEQIRARHTDVADAESALCKRNIDHYTQRRHEAVAALEREFLAASQEGPVVVVAPDARLSSETVSALVDRLSILALRIHHMRQQASEPQYGARLESLTEQRADLAGCLDRLLCDARRDAGGATNYRPFGNHDNASPDPEPYRQRAKPAQTVRVDVLISTCERPCALAVTLTSIFAQTHGPLRIVVSDQGEQHLALAADEVRVVQRLLGVRGHSFEVHRHLPQRGPAEQRDFLLSQAKAPYVLFLDDDVVLEADLIERLLDGIREQQCGFIGSAVIGTSHVGEERPQQEAIEFWKGRVEPETVVPDSLAWARHHLHRAANLYHVQRRLGLTRATQRFYRVAWVGGCVLFDTAKLRAAGGFGFWQLLPRHHRGEDVYAQLRVMARDGGCGLIPSGAYHQELPTTVSSLDVDAPRVLGLG